MPKKRLFQRKQYSNPFFAKKGNYGTASNSVKRKKLRLPKVLYLVIALAGFFILNYASAFKIDEVEVIGTQRIKPAEVQQLVLDQAAQRRFIIFKQGNIFLFSRHQATQSIRDQFLVEKVKVKKRYFNKIKVEIIEKESGVAWISNGQQHYLDLAGIALQELSIGEGIVIQQAQGNTDVIRSEIISGGFPVVYDLSNTNVAIGQQVTTEELVNFVLTIFEELSLTADFEIASFNVERPFSRDLVMKTKEGWEARFNIVEDPMTQAGILVSVLQQQIKDRDSLQYIDLRFGERVFYQ